MPGMNSGIHLGIEDPTSGVIKVMNYFLRTWL
jgi:hypothetical protein